MSSIQSPADGTFFLDKILIIDVFSLNLMPFNSQIEEIILPIIEQSGAFLVDISVRKSNVGHLVEIFIDTDSGITTDRCAEISRQIGKEIDAVNIFEKRYHLVVSSPGIDRPLKLPRQYPRNIGRTLRVKHRQENGVAQSSGVLTESDAMTIVLRLEDESLKRIAFDAIIDAHVQPVW
jgi:ribosome maturation factor RimP